MKTLKTIIATLLFLCVVGWLTAKGDSGVSGTPYNPNFGAITSNTITSTTVTAKSGGLIAKSTNGLHNITLLPAAVTSGAAQIITSDNQLLIHVQGATNCLSFQTNDIATSLLLPCSGSSSGAGNYVFTANAAQTVKSGQFYGFNVVNNGSTCAVAASSPGLPSGWSLSHPGTGRCLFTFPAVASAAAMMPVTMPNGAISFCAESASSTTTLEIKCFSAAGAVADVAFFVYIQDWN